MATQLENLLRLALADTRFEPTHKRIRVLLDGAVVADGVGALAWEPKRVVPTYALRVADIVATLTPTSEPSADVPDDPILYPNVGFEVHTASGRALDVTVGSSTRQAAAFALSDPDVADLVVFDSAAFDWLEEDEPIAGHPRDPFHRIDIRRSSRTVRLESGGRVLAESSRVEALFETSIPVVRYYFPPDDVVAELVPTDTTTYCPYKGAASYFSTDVDGEQLADVAWTYPQPFPEATQIDGLIAFYQERLDVFVDGASQG